MMNEVITIENTKMQIKEYNGQRVVTLKDIDQVHGKKDDTAKKSFRKYKKHFVLGEDYFEMTRRELGERYSPKEKILGNPTLKTYLLTESGYLMIVKTFTDDLSWKVQRQLVNAYFKVKDGGVDQVGVPYLQTRYPKYLKSSTRVPKNPSWYERNIERVKLICGVAGCNYSILYEVILDRLGEEYNLKAANEIYERETGYKPKHQIDLLSYFPDLGRMADEVLDKFEKAAKNELQKRKASK